MGVCMMTGAMNSKNSVSIRVRGCVCWCSLKRKGLVLDDSCGTRRLVLFVKDMVAVVKGN